MSWVVYMIKKIKYIIIILLVFLMAPNVNAKEQVNLYLFWGDGCPHCEAEQTYLEELADEFRNLKMKGVFIHLLFFAFIFELL